MSLNFNVTINHKQVSWNETAVEKKLQSLAGADRKKQWIQRDITVTPSSGPGRFLWVFVKNIPFLRDVFFKINLNQTSTVLQELGDQIKKRHQTQAGDPKDLSLLFNNAIEHFNALFPHHQLKKLDASKQPSSIASGITTSLPSQSSSVIDLNEEPPRKMEEPALFLEDNDIEIENEDDIQFFQVDDNDKIGGEPNVEPSLPKVETPEPKAKQKEVRSTEKKWNEDLFNVPENSKKTVPWFEKTFLQNRALPSHPGIVHSMESNYFRDMRRTWETKVTENNKDYIYLKGQASLMYCHLINLSNRKWINDPIVNAFLEKFQSKKVGIYSSYFYSSIEQELAKKGKISKENTILNLKPDQFKQTIAKKQILLPVYHQAHWTLAVIDFEKQKIEHYDSLVDDPKLLGKIPGNEGILKNVESWLKSQYKRANKPYPNFTTQDMPAPQQKNGYDCGAFMCRFGERIARDKRKEDGSWDFAIEKENIGYYRAYMAYKLLKAQLDKDLDEGDDIEE